MHGGMTEQPSATKFRTVAGGKGVKFQFVGEEGGAVNTTLQHRRGKIIPIKRNSEKIGERVAHENHPARWR